MSLLSRSTEGRRRPAAKMAAVFAGTLLTYLVVTAVPAMAVSTCDTGTAGQPFRLNVNVGTDDNVALVVSGVGQYFFSQNGLPFAACGATNGASTQAAIQWIDVRGSDAGNETFVMLFPDGQQTGLGGAWTNENTTVDLGNGTDSLIVNYAGGTFGGVPFADEPDDNQWTMLTANDGTTQVGDMNNGGAADLRVDNAENITVNAGSGNDTDQDLSDDDITASAGNATTVLDNIPAAGSGAQDGAPFAKPVVVNGGTGDDLLESGGANDTFAGGPGDDEIQYDASPSGVTVDLAAGTSTGGLGADVLSDIQDIQGSGFDDTLLGNSLDNDIAGGDGNDTINGREGNDGNGIADAAGITQILDGQGDDDHMIGGTGNDVVNGSNGDDVIDEEAAPNGADLLSGGAGFDILDHSARTTSIHVTAGSIAGDDGAAGEGDTVGGDFERYLGGSAADNYSGTNNNEEFQPNGGDDVVDGNGAGGDLLDISEATTDTTVDLVAGTANGDGNDTFTDIEAVATGSGNDTVLWDGVVPLVNFISDGGTDTVDASQAVVGVTINLAAFGNGQEVENAIGGSGNDTLTGNVLNNTLIGNDGNDVISAGLGNDFVEGGQGNDSISDGGGADTLSYRNAPAGVTVDTANGFASGGDGEDSISGIFETVLGSNFADNITAGQTAFDLPNRLQGFQGDDIITGSNSTDLVRGGPGNDQVRGGGGDDVVRGAGGNDLLLGGNGDDTLKGGGGNDHLEGGKGFDIGNGGSGADFCNGVEVAKSC